MKYKINDVVLCVSESYLITINKYYTIVKEHNTLCYIVNDRGNECIYNGRFFKDKSEVREIKINKILGI